jgi:DNA-binding NtrC family response regulator
LAHVLIVTGNKLVRWSLKEILTKEGFSADTALMTSDSLARISNKSYSLIILDYEARRTDKIDILEKIDELFPSANIIILSNFGDEQQGAFLKKPNILSVIKKPFSVGQIKDAAVMALASPGANQGR